MNQFFSFNRFSLLVLKHWADNKRRYGLSVLAFIGLLIAWFTLTMILGDDELMSGGMQEATYFFFLITTGTFYASQYYSDLGSKSKASNFLLIPASSFEKFLCGLLYNVIFFVGIFTALFYLVDLLMITISNFISASGKATIASVFTVNILHINSESSINFLLVFFSVQSAFLLGSVYFNKYNFIKTIIIGVVVWLLIFSMMFLSYREFVPEGDTPDNPIPEWAALVILFVLYGSGPFLWIVTYYRLKQKQV